MDNMIIVQELIHTLSLKKGKSGFMVIKIDLEKPYDRLDWNFIRDMLNLYKFPPHLIKLILSYVSTTSISVLFNGGKLYPFLPLRGIRQGDPLSPYIFILCMEMLSFFVQDKCTNNLWDPLKLACGGPAFSYLCYADDLVLFAKPDLKNSQSIKEVLESFCELSSLKVNLLKSKIFFSPNVSQLSRDSICETIGFEATSNLGKYLEFSLKQSCSTRHDFDFIIDRVKSKLARWKSNLLSMVGRCVLTNSITSAIPAYIMQGIILPARIHNALDKINRNFVWGSTEVKRKIHLVGWDKVTSHKDEGGLGIKATK